MRLPAPFHPSGEHLAVELDGARVLFTTRRGGHSRGPYESLNLGRLTDDDPEAVARNRQTLQERLEGARLRFVRQVHGARVVQAAPYTELPEADGLVTSRRGEAVAVLTADCLPVAVAGGGAVAMLHAGWRGLATGVIEAGVRALRDLVAGEAPLAAAIGPGAGPCCYEVGPEVHAAFASEADSVHVDGRLDLKAIAAAQLRRAGVERIHDIGLCTICSAPELLFSHRRDRGITGRQAGVAWLS